jgi:hypothetical protein
MLFLVANFPCIRKLKVEKATKVSNVVNQSLSVWIFGGGGENTT